MKRLVTSLAFCAAAVSAAPASAHLELLSPVSRYGGSVLKTAPCGQGDGPRSGNVTTFMAGETITIEWDEYVDHPGHYRIAFDADGQDDFVDPACLANCDTRDMEIELYTNDAVLMDGIEDKQGGTYTVELTLPDTPCDNCTLQVIQVMTDKPPYTIGGNDNYYQCADLILLAGDGPTDMGGNGGDVDMGTGGEPDTGSAGNNGTTGTNNTTGPTNGGEMDMGSSTDDPGTKDLDDEGGCTTAGGNSGLSGLLVLLVGLGFLRRRQRF